ncbi:MAG: very short patch repair endonuclease [Thermodesulfobacteriota bacterium]|nr:very short patch repair endonuclease [Thermodesulfobacteriota bacterium]
MTDVYSEEKRSQVMSRVHGKNTKPEICVRSALHREGYRFRLHRVDLPGKPDIVLPLYHTVIFVNGCFWHQHPGCRKATIPQNNRPFWKRKLTRTVQRDAQNKADLLGLGWNVITIWECEMRNSMDATMRCVLKELKKAGRQNAERVKAGRSFKIQLKFRIYPY